MSRRSTRSGGRHTAGRAIEPAVAEATPEPAVDPHAEAAAVEDQEQTTPASDAGDRPLTSLVSSPIRLDRHAWWGVLRRVVREYRTDDVSDWAAALTYRAMLAIFPGMLVLIAIIGMLGNSTNERLQSSVEKHAPGSARSTISDIFK